MGTISGWAVGWVDLGLHGCWPVNPDKLGPGIRLKRLDLLVDIQAPGLRCVRPAAQQGIGVSLR
jgi:hypothetical protein